ncbi:hypothetical protein [Haladaptatus sp. NG-SE-30]
MSKSDNFTDKLAKAVRQQSNGTVKGSRHLQSGDIDLSQIEQKSGETATDDGGLDSVSVAALFRETADRQRSHSTSNPLRGIDSKSAAAESPNTDAALDSVVQKAATVYEQMTAMQSELAALEEEMDADELRSELKARVEQLGGDSQ